LSQQLEQFEVDYIISEHTTWQKAGYIPQSQT